MDKGQADRLLVGALEIESILGIPTPFPTVGNPSVTENPLLRNVLIAFSPLAYIPDFIPFGPAHAQPIGSARPHGRARRWQEVR